MAILNETSPPPVAPKKKSRKWLWITGIVVAAVVGISLGNASAKTPAPQPTAAPAPVTVTAAAPPAVTVTAEAAVPVTVTEAAAAPVTVTAAAPPAATVTAAPAAPAVRTANTDPAGPKANGKFLIGSQVLPGTWQCDKPGSMPNWTVNAQDNSIIDIELDSIAIVPDSGYTLTLGGCNGLWSKVG